MSIGLASIPRGCPILLTYKNGNYQLVQFNKYDRGEGIIWISPNVRYSLYHLMSTQAIFVDDLQDVQAVMEPV
jgi:hypothetical protein